MQMLPSMSHYIVSGSGDFLVGHLVLCILMVILGVEDVCLSFESGVSLMLCHVCYMPDMG